MRTIIGTDSKRCARHHDISIRIVSLALAGWGLAACSSTAPMHDAAADTASPANDAPTDNALCAVPLDAAQPFGGCPATFDDTSWRARACFGFVVVKEQVCTGYLSRDVELGTHGWTCYYDPTSKELVAGRFQDDVADLRDPCGNMKSILVVGTTPPTGTCNAPQTLDNPCDIHDGSADSEGGVDGS